MRRLAFVISAVAMLASTAHYQTAFDFGARAWADDKSGAGLQGKWCFDDTARKLLQQTINISLPQKLPAQEFDKAGGVWHMYMDPALFPGLPKGTTRLLIPSVRVSIEPNETIKIVQVSAPWKDIVPSLSPEGAREIRFFTVSFFQGKIGGGMGQRQLAFEVDLRFAGRDRLAITEISLTFDAGSPLTYTSDSGPISLSRC